MASQESGPTYEYDIFVSYSSRDREWVQNFHEDLVRDVNLLGQRDVRAFLDTGRLKVGFVWETALEQAARRSSVLVAVLSPRYFESEYCQKELQFFSESHPEPASAHRSRIVPILHLCQAPSGHTLSNIQGQSFFENRGGVPFDYQRGAPEYSAAVRKTAHQIVQLLHGPAAPSETVRDMVAPPVSPRRGGRRMIAAIVALAVVGLIVWLAAKMTQGSPDGAKAWSDAFNRTDGRVSDALWRTIPPGWKPVASAEVTEEFGNLKLLKISGPGTGLFPNTRSLDRLTDYTVKFNVRFQGGLREISWMLRAHDAGRGYVFTFRFPSKQGEEFRLVGSSLPGGREIDPTYHTQRTLNPLGDGDILEVTATTAGAEFRHTFRINDANVAKLLPTRNNQNDFEAVHLDNQNAHRSGLFGLRPPEPESAAVYVIPDLRMNLQ